MNFGTTNVLQHGPRWCQSLLPNTAHHALEAALVCGISLPPGTDKQLFLDTGLIHIMVVSGAHLIFLESLLPPRVRLPVLAFYCWMTGFGPPVVKAFAHRIAESQLKPRGWTSLQAEAAAVLVTLTIWPFWITSRSLQMSWMCFLALSLPPLFRWKAFDQSLKTYLLLFLFVGASTLSIFWNTLIAPLVGTILFPCSLTLLILPVLAPLVERVWDVFLFLLNWGPKSQPAAWFFSSRDLFWLPLTLHICLLIREVRCRRAQAFL